MNRVVIRPRGRRLFVSNDNGGAFILAATLLEARLEEPGARYATAEDVRAFLETLDAEPTAEIARRLDVSRQTLHHWRRRAGVGKPPATDTPLARAVLAQLRDGLTTEEIAARVGCASSTVRRIAREAGKPRRRPCSYPPDDEIVVMAAGKTWPDLAAALGRQLTVARAYIYARPNLARAVRAVMVLSAPGKKPSC